MTTHQVLLDDAPYRADIAGEAVYLQKYFDRTGTSMVVARHVDGSIPGMVVPQTHAHRGAHPAYVVHASVADASLQHYIERLGRNVTLRYHGAGGNASADRVEASMTTLRALRSCFTHAIATTQDAADDLGSLGYRDVGVVRTITDCRALLHDVLSNTRDFPIPLSDVNPLILFAGDIVPGRRLDDLIAAFHILRTYHRPGVHLIIAGLEADPPCTANLVRFLRELGLPDVTVMERATRVELAACFFRADMLVSLDSGGLPVMPFIQAMATHTPILSVPNAAVRDATGDAAWFVPMDSPSTIAEAQECLLSTPALSERLRTRGERQAHTVDASVTLPAFISALEGAV